MRPKTIIPSRPPEQAEEGIAKAKASGIAVLILIIFGIGGKERSRQHIIETTSLLNIMKPEEIAPMALAIQPGTELEKEVQRGNFLLPTPLQILEEEKYLLENITSFDTFYWGDHGNNIVPLKGRLPESRELFSKKIDRAIVTHPVCKEKVLQTFAW